MKTFLLLLSVTFAGIAYARYFDDDDNDDDKDYSRKGCNRGPPERTHLVTMRREELMDIVRCVSDAIARKDVKTCENFARCEKMMSPMVIRAYKSCRRALTGVPWTRCIPGQPLFTDPEMPERIFDCIEDNTDKEKETPEDRLDMAKFEQCSRKVRDRGCKYSSKRGDTDTYVYFDKN